MGEGWFKVHRMINDHPFFEGRIDRLGAFIWMLGEASHKPKRKEINGKIVTLERGQLVHSRAFMARAWGWSPSAVERFLTRLKTEQMIGQATGQGKRVITICNYDKYQDMGSLTGQATGQATGQRSDSDRTEPKERKKERIRETQSLLPTTESIEDRIFSKQTVGQNKFDHEFDDWWKHAPKKVGKGQARKAYRSARKKTDADTLKAGIEAYGKNLNGIDHKFICNPATWLNGERWLDEDAHRPDLEARIRELIMGDGNGHG